MEGCAGWGFGLREVAREGEPRSRRLIEVAGVSLMVGLTSEESRWASRDVKSWFGG